MNHHFTRGGQIAMHSFRMLKQISWTTLTIAFIGSFSFFGIKTYKEVRPYQWYLLKEYIYAGFMLSLTFDKPQNLTQEFIYPDGQRAKIRSIDVERNPYFRRHISYIEQTLNKNLKLSLFLGGALLLISFIYFTLRGKLQFRNKIERGTFVAPAKEVKRLLRKNKEVSDLCLDLLPLCKGSETSHTFITGTTGAGKSNCFHTLLPQIRRRGDRAIIVDLTGDFVAKYYDETKDILINPFDKRSSNWNIWQELQSEAQFDSFSEACIPPATITNDRFWDQAGSKILSTALKKLKERDTPSFSKLYEILVLAPLEEYHKFFEGTEAAAFTDKKADKTTLSIRSTLVNQISFFKYLLRPPHESCFSFSIRDWIEEKSNEEKEWVFLSARADQRNSLRPFISALVDTAINSLMTLSPNESRKHWFIIDELPALQKLPSLEMGLAEIRKYGGCILSGVQSIPQLSSVYGRAQAQTMLDLFNTKIFFRNTDPDTTQWISRVLGETELMETKENLSYGANTIRDGVSLSNFTRTKPIVLPTEIANLKNLECYVKIPGSYPVTKINMSYKKLVDINKGFIMREDNDFSFKEDLRMEANSEESILVMDM